MQQFGEGKNGLQEKKKWDARGIRDALKAIGFDTLCVEDFSHVDIEIATTTCCGHAPPLNLLTIFPSPFYPGFGQAVCCCQTTGTGGFKRLIGSIVSCSNFCSLWVIEKVIN